MINAKELLVAIEEILARHPNDTRLKFSKAILLQQEGKNAESLQLAEAILTREEDINAVILKITSLEALERSEEAEAFPDFEGRVAAEKSSIAACLGSHVVRKRSIG